MNRRATIERKTNETQIRLTFNLDGSGDASLKTDIGFFNHMLQLFSVHGAFDLALDLNGDTDVDYHHSVEDVGICLGQAFRNALGNGQGIRRYASGLIPMDESLCQMAIDISNRPLLVFHADFPKTKIGNFDLELVHEFFQAFVNNARITLHIRILEGTNLHHMAESCFKAFGRLLNMATELIPGETNIPSSKGVL